MTPQPDRRSEPEQFQRRVLLAVTGLSPQVVTETLYALAVAQRPTFLPTEVHVVTTQEGAQRLRLALLSAQPGWFARLCSDYALPAINFTEANIHVVTCANGAPLADIRSPQDNQWAADFITEQVRSFTADDDCALHVSMAGGRKTMGFYIGYALSLFGRAQDRLSHVLVSEPFEASLDFFYPTPYSRVIAVRDKVLADTAAATVTLADIPFVSLRQGLPAALLAGQASFNGTVAAARRALAPAELVLDLPQRRIQAAGLVLKLPPASLALLALFARRTINGEAALAAPTKTIPDAELAAAFLAELRLISGLLGDTDRTQARLADGMGDDFFAQTLSRLQRCLKEALGPAALPYLIDNGGTRQRRYRLALAPQAIRFAELFDSGAGGRANPRTHTQKAPA
ncbi:CRISPR-associated ring nuclease Csm6 [Roseateles sp. GG27B]